jgi:hypothetical protein
MADTHIQRGIGVVWGVTTTGYECDGIACNFRPEEEDITMARQVEEHFDGATGAVLGETYFRLLTTLRFRVYPSAPTIAQAELDNMLPEPGTELKIQTLDASRPDPDVHPDAPVFGNAIGYWAVRETSKARQVGSKVYFDITVIRHGDNGVGSAIRTSQIVPAT